MSGEWRYGHANHQQAPGFRHRKNSMFVLCLLCVLASRNSPVHDLLPKDRQNILQRGRHRPQPKRFEATVALVASETQSEENQAKYLERLEGGFARCSQNEIFWGYPIWDNSGLYRRPTRLWALQRNDVQKLLNDQKSIHRIPSQKRDVSQLVGDCALGSNDEQEWKPAAIHP